MIRPLKTLTIAVRVYAGTFPVPVSLQATSLHVAVSFFLRRLGVSCGKQVKEESLHAPSYNPADQSCTFQAMPLLFSCVAKDPARMRLCPCRDYQPQQVAFCKNCD